MKKKAPLPENRSWLNEEIFSQASNFFANLLAGIHSAQNSIDLDFYIFQYDSLGEQVSNALIKAAERGVKVRLIMDGIGSAETAGEIANKLSAANCQVRIFHPHPFYPHLYHWSITQGNFLKKFMHFMLYINHRDHHKICIIDSQFIWTGSFNISKSHLSKKDGGENWHDYGIKLSDPHMQQFTDYFDQLWNQVDFNLSQTFIHQMQTRVARPYLLGNHFLISRIRNAKQRIWICTAYFAPSQAVLRAIKTARSNGIDVQLILPAKSDVAVFPLISSSYYKKLLEKGVRIFEYQPSILHAKLMLVDNLCILGSTNINHRSFYHDLEMNVVVSNKNSIRQIESYFSIDRKNSRAITMQDTNNNFLWRLSARLLRLFRYWL